MKMHPALLLPLSLLAAQQVFAECRHTTPRNADIDAAGARKIIVASGAGDVVIAGDASATHVRVTGEACAETAQDLDGVQLEARRDGDTVYVRAIMPKQRNPFGHPSLDLALVVPASLALELTDSSGDLSVRSVAAAKIDDSSGDVSVRDVATDVTVDDSSGDIEIDRVSGNVVVRDSSGEVRVEDVGGNVSIPVDSSGALGLRRIRGNVHIGSDSSGNIVLAEINQNVQIDNDSSGRIRASDVGGSLTVANGTGDIEHRNVLGEVRIPRRD